MSTIIPIHGGRRSGEPDAELVKEIEELLTRARSGELLALGYASVDANDRLATAWVGAGGTRDKLGCAIAMLDHRYMAGLLEPEVCTC